MRPKGSCDSKKRKRKNILGGSDERNLIEDYNDGLSVKDLMRKYNVTKSAISSLFSRRGVSKRICYSDVKVWEVVSDVENLEDNICGIYAIYFTYIYEPSSADVWSKINNIKVYIGSSINIKQRLRDHVKSLKDNSHYSTKLKKYFNDDRYKMNLAIIERCGSDNIMQKEGVYQNKYNWSCLLNSWVCVQEGEILPYLQKAVTLKSYKDYVVNKDGCWECKSVHKSGYGRLKVVAFKDWGPGKIKHFYTHRVAYWEKYGKYPELIRHKCNNSKCRNPDHLAEGNYSDNNIDRRGNFPEVFKNKWIEYGGDVYKLTDYFGWNGNCKLKGGKVSTAVYSWEKKLGLRDKFPEILASNGDRKII